MTLTKEIKMNLFNIMQEVSTKDDISYIKMLLDLRVKEIDADSPKGMKKGIFG